MKEYTDFFSELGMLKHKKREGWRSLGVAVPESVADHVMRAAQIAFFIAKKEGVDPYKTATISLFHELGECKLGDLDYTAKKYCSVDEERAVSDVLAIPEHDEVLSLWKDFEEKRTSEGIIAKDADTIELVLQAKEYQKTGINTISFIENAKNRLMTTTAKELYEVLNRD
ncbi:MAG: HD domain-containing protein [Candidatus Woesearchaeota archaeon]